MTQKEKKKGVFGMTDGIGRIGGSNYGYAGYGLPRQGEDAPKNPTAEPTINNYEDTQVDPAKVMDFLAANNFFVAPTGNKVVGDVDAATQERIEGYMENFELIYGIIVDEFGEELAPDVMNIAMDYLMGLAA